MIQKSLHAEGRRAERIAVGLTRRNQGKKDLRQPVDPVEVGLWWVSLDPGTVAVLEAHRTRAESWADAAAVDFAPDGCVFTLDPFGRTPWRPDSFGHAVDRYAWKTGAKIRLHDLRHLSVTQLIAAGVDVRTVGDAMAMPIHPQP